MKFRSGGNPDKNNQAVADLARRLGADVRMTTQVGFGFPDQVWGFRGLTILVEVTNPNAKTSPKFRERKAKQERFRKQWAGGLVVEVKTGDDVVKLLTGDTIRQLQKEQLDRVTGAWVDPRPAVRDAAAVAALPLKGDQSGLPW